MTASRTHHTRKVPAIRATGDGCRARLSARMPARIRPPLPAQDEARGKGSGRSPRLKQVPRMAGVTLIELVITLSIAAILMTIAVPSFQDLMRNNRTAAQVNEFLTALNLARSEAVKRGASVSVCSSADSATCRTDSPINWAGGWILYVNGTTPEVLRVWPAISGTATFTATAGEVTFRSTGQATAAITFTYKPTGCTGDQKRTITVTAVGRATSSKTTCSP